jgi:hypothetical protein
MAERGVELKDGRDWTSFSRHATIGNDYREDTFI